MIVYLDASALVKRYLAEAGSAEVDALVGQATVVATSLISRAEVSAAISRAVRSKLVGRQEAEEALTSFRREWDELAGTEVTKSLVGMADTLAWEHGLRGYDAVHLASALLLRDHLGQLVTLATFDRELSGAAPRVGLAAWPERLE